MYFSLFNSYVMLLMDALCEILGLSLLPTVILLLIYYVLHLGKARFVVYTKWCTCNTNGFHITEFRIYNCTDPLVSIMYSDYFYVMTDITVIVYCKNRFIFMIYVAFICIGTKNMLPFLWMAKQMQWILNIKRIFRLKII